MGGGGVPGGAHAEDGGQRQEGQGILGGEGESHDRF